MNLSQGAKRIADILSQNHYKFELEKTFSDLHNYYKASIPLRFDFCVYNEDESINCLIEYDSEIHFKQIKRFHRTKQDFLAAQERDRRKNSYCLARNMTLYRIPYWEINNINTFDDMRQDKFRVKSKWHNDKLK